MCVCVCICDRLQYAKQKIMYVCVCAVVELSNNQVIALPPTKKVVKQLNEWSFNFIKNRLKDHRNASCAVLMKRIFTKIIT